MHLAVADERGLGEEATDLNAEARVGDGGDAHVGELHADCRRRP
jgi:hypothetical protein